ncbi:MAG TPA: Ppx/GppA phosphatase family protein [Bacteroidota bacterium]|nr:Ppx/GppA phosphatase family protein [Bacteroidota bacterium]
MRIGVIDIGTNTILLLVVDVDENGIVRTVHDEQVIARLGKGVDEHRVINDETLRRVSGFIETYLSTCRALKTEKVIAVGTSALRDAANRREFCDFMYRSHGLQIEILSGDDEAQWTFRGALSANRNPEGMFTVLDIGGGSTEIILGNTARIVKKTSLDIGCVRISERMFRSLPPSEQMLADSQKLIRTALSSCDLGGISFSVAIGVAGTVTTLAAIALNLQQYDPSRVEGFVLSVEDVKGEFDRLKKYTLEETTAIRQISPGRADIILAGVLVLLEFMTAAGLKKIAASDRGLRYGIALREVEKNRSFHLN